MATMDDRDGVIWLDGELVPWREAKTHVLTHTLHYGMGVFEGVRCYKTVDGPAIFRLRDHTNRLFNSAHIYGMAIPFTRDEIDAAQLACVQRNNLESCYIRPIVFYGSNAAGIWTMQRLRGDFFINSYVKAKVLTHDPARVASYNADPMITRPISVNMLLGLYETAERVVGDARAITVPTQLFVSGSDWVVHHGPQHEFFVNLGTPLKERHILPGFFHDTLGERDRAPVVAKIRDFIQARFAAPLHRPDLLEADRHRLDALGAQSRGYLHRSSPGESEMTRT